MDPDATYQAAAVCNTDDVLWSTRWQEDEEKNDLPVSNGHDPHYNRPSALLAGPTRSFEHGHWRSIVQQWPREAWDASDATPKTPDCDEKQVKQDIEGWRQGRD